MPSRFQTNFQERVRPAAERAFAIDIVYWRRAESVELKAFEDSSLFESSNAFGITQTKTKDFLIDVSKLIIAGERVSPAKGDVIVVGSKKHVVTSQPGGRPDSYDDNCELVWRVHTTFSEAI